MGETLVFRTTFSRFFPAVAAAVALVVLISVIAQSGWAELWQSAPVILFVLALIWALFWRPLVEISDGGIRLVNIIRTTWIPWPVFRSAQSQWTLQVHTSHGTFSSWALPASSGSARRLARSRGGELASQRFSDSGAQPGQPGRTAEAAALEIGRRVESLTRAGYLDQRPAGTVAPEQHFDPVALIVLAAAGVAAAGGLAWG